MKCNITLKIYQTLFNKINCKLILLPYSRKFSRDPIFDYRIAGNFRGIQFSRFSRLTGKPRKLNPRNKSLNAHSRSPDHPSATRNVHPRKLHREIFAYCLSAKIGSLENVRLYGNFIFSVYMYVHVHVCYTKSRH